MNSALPEIYVSKSDFERLSSLAFHSNAPTAGDLEEELDRAVVVSDQEMPSNVVAMNSTIEFRNLDSNTNSKITLVYPDAAQGDGSISILAPVGIALLGLRLNDVIEWPMPGGFTRRLQVVGITSRSEQTA